MRYDVAIIGAGFAGLAAGIRLAHFGKRVVILEKHSVWGGLNSFYKKGGHHFDTGLHAVTNYVRPGYKGPRLPLQRIARQLRFDLSELELLPQSFSEIVLGDASLRFSNDFAFFEASIAAAFPGEIDGFRRLTAACAEYPDLFRDAPHVSTRRMLAEFIAEPVLRELILAPVLWYGSAEEHDIDFEQFVILFNSIYREGFARPRRGVRGILDVLMRRLAEAGGTLRRRAGVGRLIVEGGAVRALELEDGERVEADVVLSSAGLVETMRLRSDLGASPAAGVQLRGGAGVELRSAAASPGAQPRGDADGQLRGHAGAQLPGDAGAPVRGSAGGRLRGHAQVRGDERGDYPVGRLAFVETIWVLDSPPAAWGHEACVTFFASERATRWAAPSAGVDLSSGVICCPSNYPGASGEPVIRATHLASPDVWLSLEGDAYVDEKRRWNQRSLEAVERRIGKFSPRIVYVDSFTPRTVRHFTSKENGAIYGSPRKLKTGATDLSNLFLCGTDQGLAGIVGAMLSGINMANAYGGVRD